MPQPHKPRAFTLIELLVVITIIVVLLALLAPGLDRAVYQAQLAECSGRLKAVSGSAVVYAMNQRRAYPYRVGARDPDWSEANAIRNANPFFFGSNWDERPVLRHMLDLDLLVCPLRGPVDLAVERLDIQLVLTPYALRFDFAFAGESRMSRVGDRWASYNPTEQVIRFPLITDAPGRGRRRRS